MASHTFSIGAPSSAASFRLNWEPPGGNRAIPSPLGSGFLRLLELRTFNDAISLYTDSTDSDSGLMDGPDLSSAWESSSVAITINAPGISYSIGGPNSSSATSQDDSEPYSWSVSSSELTRIQTFIASYRALTSQQQATTTLTLDDGVVPHTDTHTDTSHADQHTNTPHVNQHTDGAPHADQHTNTPHADQLINIPHTDQHTNEAHQDSPHTDIAHVNQHTNTPHTNTAHSDGAHQDAAHSDTHSDTAHLDVIHLDVAHSDGAHLDIARLRSHGDTAHTDTHTDSHLDTATSGEAIIAHWLLEFKGLDYTVWSGESDLNYDGKVYKGAGRFIELSQLDYQVDQPNNRLTATLVAGSEEVQQIFVSDDKIYLVEIQWIISIDGGVNFLPTGREYLGRTNGPTYSNGQYTIEIEPTLSDQFRQQPVYWSDEEQQATYPGDLGLNYASELIDGVKKGKWPR